MRLTLRTLLAYLDDTLDASEIKEIGEKVAESDAAQELIARIKQVTRRRRLTVPPPSGPEATDPNDVAEYLDNVLSADKVAELEKVALESDVHLAEIAASHQILTLVLGEPALVPPKARERMYGLVRGREAIPYRKAQTPKKANKEMIEDEEELALSSGWLRWVLPVAASLLVALLALAVYQVLPEGKPRDTRLASTDPGKQKPGEDPARDPEPPSKDKEKEKGEEKPVGSGKEKEPVKEKEKETEKEKPTVPVTPPSTPVEQNPAVVERTAPPSTNRVAVGNYVGGLSGLPTALLYRGEGNEAWERYGVGNTVHSKDTLLALPGFASGIRTRTGVMLLLRGHIREFTIAPIMDYLMESAVVLHENAKFDLDLTLLRGRIYLTNRKASGPAKIRLRFESEVWDLTLGAPGDRVAVDLTRSYSPLINYRQGEEPRAQCYLALLQGEAEIKIDAYHTYNVEVESPKWARMEWDSFTRTRGPIKEDKQPLALSEQPPSPELLTEARREGLRRMQAALKDLEVLLGTKKATEVALKELLERKDPAARVLAIYGLTAIDAIGTVIDVLGDEDPNHFLDREAAFYSLQRWVARSANNSKQLYDEKTGTGILIEKKYRKGEAETVLQLLHPLLAEDLSKAETYEALAQCLKHRKVAIAELGFWHLVWLSGGVKLPTGFNAALPQEDREKYAAQIHTLIEKKQLPPMRGERGTGSEAGGGKK